MKILETDVLIIGAGVAGISAALSASNQNLKVTIIEQSNTMGGKATLSEVGTICGLFYNSKEKDSKFLVSGFTKLFSELLQNKTNQKVISNHLGLHYLPFSVTSFNDLVFELLAQKQIQNFLDSKLLRVTTNKNLFSNASFINENKLTTKIKFKAIIDCSGDSIVSQTANLPYYSEKNYQAASQIFTLGNVHFTNEFSFFLTLIKKIKQGILNQTLGKEFLQLFVVEGSYKQNQISLKLTIPIEVTNTRTNTNKINDLAKKMISELINFLNSISEFKDLKLLSIAPEIGIRVSFRSIGKYQLTEKDVLTATKFKTAIANCAWPIEDWKLKGLEMSNVLKEDYYQIPAECLISNAIQNFFFAGRIISSTSKAIASARVIACCLQTGFAAGVLAKNLVLKKDFLTSVSEIQEAQISL